VFLGCEVKNDVIITGISSLENLDERQFQKSQKYLRIFSYFKMKSQQKINLCGQLI